MKDSITIKRIWQDADLFQVEIECKSSIISVRSRVYITDESVDELCAKINTFLLGQEENVRWMCGERGDATTPSISFKMFYKDKLGHVQIEVYMELDDGGPLSKHHCCFYISTEIGQLDRFLKVLPSLKIQKLGNMIVLNEDL